jgi:3-oxoacyl-[acyl-carrier protein] reductase
MSETIDLQKARYPDLSDRRVVIAGGTGNVGEGIVRAWLATGAHVVVPSRAKSTVDQFRQVLSDLDQPEALEFVTGNYTSFDGANALAEQIVAEYGSVTDVVASIGGWWQGKPLWEITEDEWQRYFVDLSTTHVALVRAWIPRLPEKASYQLILGGSAVSPVSGASIINMQQAGLLMMRRVLSKEVGDQHRITSQMLGPVITRARERHDPNWVSKDEVGLASVGIADNPDVAHENFVSQNKTQMREVLQSLDVYPE